MIKYLRWLKNTLDLRDCTGFVGLALLGGGIGVIYWPGALIVSGLVLLYLAFVGVRRGATP